ncbi:UPF0481 protein At3g47200-like [Solanum stenotomum]|uniref:UPF0481 protein At3g47200-like n=1 Tax=Solanum stenotomum TaxID=172797 RepID=UPI0020D0CCB8|nr:UPF0481 protein At3g47200-like [Solanum stenotomum]
MAHSASEITPINDQHSLLSQTVKDEIDEGRKADHQDPNVVVSINQRYDEIFKDLDNNTCIKSATIFKVNVGLRKSNENAYTPMLISIGPYHKKNSQLDSMKKYKLLYLRRYLQRKNGLNVESCISELEKIKNVALKCYNDDLDTDIVKEFSEMLLLDGCFVVEFIRECGGEEEKEDIIKLEWMKNQVCQDMVLLENQLPFFELVILYHMTMHPNEENVLYMVRRTFLDTFPKVKGIPKSEIQGITERFDHLLDVLHMFCRPSGEKDEQNMDANSQNQCCKISFCGNMRLQLSKEIPESLDFWQCYHIPTAKELFDSGVSFLKIGFVEENDEDKTSLFDITFEKGLMKIPCFAIEDTMETFLRNMIAFEQHTSKELYPYFSNYAHLMTQLIGSHRDKLSDGVDVAIEKFYYIEECSKLTQHCEKPWNQMKASLRHNYFQSPWAGASTVAAITLLVLTVIQTVLAFTGYVNK